MGVIIDVYKDHKRIYVLEDDEELIDPKEEDRRTLADRIREAVDEYGAVYCDRETADRFFHATWGDFMTAVAEVINDGYRMRCYLEKDEEEM